MFGKILKSIFQKVPVLERVDDEEFGPLIYDGNSWCSEPSSPQRGYQITFGGHLNKESGHLEPDRESIALAKQLLGDTQSFERNLKSFLKEESKEHENNHFTEEINSLEPEVVSFANKGQSLVYMVFFKDIDDDRAWRCECIDGQLCNLGFDS